MWSMLETLRPHPSRVTEILRLSLLTLLAAAIWVGTSAGMFDIAGFTRVFDRLAAVDWPFLPLALAGVVVAFAGYIVAYQGLLPDHKQRIGFRDLTAVVAAGFGGFVLTGGKAVDRYALRQSGTTDRDARVRIMALHQFEQLPIAVGAFVASIVVLTGRGNGPPTDFTVPWVIGLPVGAVVAIGGAVLVGDRFRHCGGWRGWVGIAADGLRMLRRIALSNRHVLPPVMGMCLYWAGEILAVWAAVAAFGTKMPVLTALVATATGYALTRRSVPLGGAGLIDLALPLSMWACGVPLASAVAGTVAYRVFNFWMALPPALIALPRVRRLYGSERAAPASA